MAVTASGIMSALELEGVCLKLEGVFPPKQRFPENLPADFLSSKKVGKCLVERNEKASTGLDQGWFFLGV